MTALIFALFTSSVYAQAPNITGYECDVRVIAKDLPNGFAETKITRPLISDQSHGGTPYEFKAGDHSVNVLADGKWRGISWWRGGQLIAEALTAGVQPHKGNSVFIVYNPANQEEQVQLGCDPTFGEWPKQ